MYIKRILEKRVKYLADHFPIVLLCGARQVGKTTLLKKIAEANDGIQYITLDYPRGGSSRLPSPPKTSCYNFYR